MSTHSPGPWRIAGTYFVESPDEHVVVARTIPDEWRTQNSASQREAAANARLIAVAPDMLSVIRELRSRLVDIRDELARRDVVAGRAHDAVRWLDNTRILQRAVEP